MNQVHSASKRLIVLPLAKEVSKHALTESRDVISHAAVIVTIEASQKTTGAWRPLLHVRTLLLEHGAELAGVELLLSFLPSQYPHYNGREHHQKLRHLLCIQAGCFTYALSDWRLLTAKNVAEYTSSGKGLRVTHEATEIIENSTIVVLFQRGVERLRSVRSRGIAGESTHEKRKRDRDRLLNGGGLRTNLPAHVRKSVSSKLLLDHVSE